MSLFTFPELYCPFPSKVNKYADVLEGDTLEWLLRFNLLASESSLKKFCRSKFSHLVAVVYPDCELEKLKIINDFTTVLFIWDDQCDMSEIGENPKLLTNFHQRFLEILNGEKLTVKDIPIGHALGDLRKRIIKRGNEEFLQQLVNSCKDYFRGCILQAEYRKSKIIPDVETYIIMRNLFSAVDGYLKLMELANNITFPDSIRQHDDFKKLNSMTNNIISWCNDIYSAPREIRSGDIHNLVYVIHYHEKISLNQAMKRAAEIHNTRLRELIALEKSFPSFGKDLDIQISKYISGCNDWIGGHYDWYSYSGRYHTQEKLEIGGEGLKCIAS